MTVPVMDGQLKTRILRGCALSIFCIGVGLIVGRIQGCGGTHSEAETPAAESTQVEQAPAQDNPPDDDAEHPAAQEQPQAGDEDARHDHEPVIPATKAAVFDFDSRKDEDEPSIGEPLNVSRSATINGVPAPHQKQRAPNQAPAQTE